MDSATEGVMLCHTLEQFILLSYRVTNLPDDEFVLSEIPHLPKLPRLTLWVKPEK